MSRRPQKPRLYLRERPDGRPVWEIRDGARRVSTKTTDPEEAERALAAYLAHPERRFETSLVDDPKALRNAAAKALRGAKWRSTNRGTRCHLTTDQVVELIEQQGGVCAMTGLAFFDARSSEGRRKPYAPSIDRIDNSKGYTEDNVRVVLSIVNTAKGDYTDSEFFVMCRAVADFRTQSGPSQ